MSWSLRDFLTQRGQKSLSKPSEPKALPPGQSLTLLTDLTLSQLFKLSQEIAHLTVVEENLQRTLRMKIFEGNRSNINEPRWLAELTASEEREELLAKCTEQVRTAHYSKVRHVGRTAGLSH